MPEPTRISASSCSLPGQEVDRGWPCPLACCPQGRAFQCSCSPWLWPKIEASFIHPEQGLSQDLSFAEIPRRFGGAPAPSPPIPARRPAPPLPAPLPRRDRSLRIPLPCGHTVLRASGQSAPAAACGGGRRVRVRRCGGSGAAPRALRARSLGSPFASVSTRGYRWAECLRMAGEVEMQKQKQGRASQAPSQVTRDRPLPRAHVGASGAGSTKHTTGPTVPQGDASRAQECEGGILSAGSSGRSKPSLSLPRG